MTTPTTAEQAALLKIESAMETLQGLQEEHEKLIQGPPPAMDAPDATLYAALSAAEAATGRLLDAADLLQGRSYPADNPAPFEDAEPIPTLELYRVDRVTAALMSQLRDNRTHPEAYTGAALEVLEKLPALPAKVENSMRKHSHSDLLNEIVYDDAAVMARDLREHLSPEEVHAIRNAAAEADRGN